MPTQDENTPHNKKEEKLRRASYKLSRQKIRGISPINYEGNVTKQLDKIAEKKDLKTKNPSRGVRARIDNMKKDHDIDEFRKEENRSERTFNEGRKSPKRS
ncbi:MAG TPA: hypothetical protein QF353_00585 [Gammaproteobacteria bacterium]|nr:hypothetical protein [Gammaproteobacteria bacterium]